MIQGKIWGSSELLLRTPLIEIHRLEVNPNSHCSNHVHRFKWNLFYVLAGRLEIHVEKDYGLTDVTELGPDEITTVKPGESHWFATNDSGARVLEIYYPESLSEDIVRKSVGGIHEATCKILNSEYLDGSGIK